MLDTDPRAADARLPTEHAWTRDDPFAHDADSVASSWCRRGPRWRVATRHGSVGAGGATIASPIIVTRDRMKGPVLRTRTTGSALAVVAVDHTVLHHEEHLLDQLDI